MAGAHWCARDVGGGWTARERRAGGGGEPELPSAWPAAIASILPRPLPTFKTIQVNTSIECFKFSCTLGCSFLVL
jgi:hypothetical protein